MHYRDGTEVRVGDRVRHGQAGAVVETIVDGDAVAEWELDAPGFLVLHDHGDRFLIEPGSYDWEDVVFEGRGD